MAAEEFLDPTDSVAVPRKTAARLPSLEGKVVTLLDISKAKGDHLLDRVEELLHERLHPKAVIRKRKPTSSRATPSSRPSPTEGPAQRAVCTTACFSRTTGCPRPR